MWRRGDFKDCFSQRGRRCFDMTLAPGWWGTRRPSPAQGGAEGFLKKIGIGAAGALLANPCTWAERRPKVIQAPGRRVIVRTTGHWAGGRGGRATPRKHWSLGFGETARKV